MTVDIAGNYRILEKLGEGGMGEVFKCLDGSLEREVAIKALRPELTKHPELLGRFRKEAVALARLNHPNIAALYSFVSHGEGYYMVMEFAPGKTLDRVIAEHGAGLPWKRALLLFLQALQAIKHAHHQGIVHRDIKPRNMMLGDNETLKVLDFGIARVPDDARITRTGFLLGTPKYMAPEQIMGREVDVRCDIYSLGVVLYEMLAGHAPFEASSEFDLMRAHIEQRPVPVRQIIPDIPEAVDAAIMRSLEKVPDNRFQKASEFISALLPVLRGLAQSEFHEGFPFDTDSDRRRVTDGNLAHTQAEMPAAPAWWERARDWFTGTRRKEPPALDRSPSDRRGERMPDDGTVVGLRATSIDIPVPAVDGPGAPSPDETMMISVGDISSEANVVTVALAIINSPDAAQIGRRITLSQFPFRIGRAADADLSVPGDMGISRHHVVLSRDARGYQIQDVSTNGTYLNGHRIRDQEPLLLGDTIALSRETSFRFIADLPALPNLSGKVLDGRYELGDSLHASMKAATYSARDKRIPRSLAVKVLSPALTRWPHYRDEFTRQAHMAAMLNHPHICTVVDSGEARIDTESGLVTVPYHCMVLMAGGDLAQRLDRQDQLPMEMIVLWTDQIGSALDHAHRTGIIHGGLKPSSIVFDQNDTPYLTDFALANRQVDESKGRTVLGAPAFLAPEQWEGEPAGPATDQYSLAVLVYLMVSAARPFEGQSDPDVRRRNFERGAIPVHEEAARNQRENVPAAISIVLARAMSVSPEDRYASIGEFVRAIKQAVHLKPVSGEPRIFLSYHRESSAGWAVLLARELQEKYRISVYLDTGKRDRAVPFPEKLKQAVSECDVFVCLLAEHTFESAWVQEEIRLAFEQSKPMVPVFQESFRDQQPGAGSSLEALLHFDGVHLLDRRNIHVDHTIADLADIIRRTVA